MNKRVLGLPGKKRGTSPDNLAAGLNANASGKQRKNYNATPSHYIFHKAPL
jgi:hypothetical protein